MTEGPLAGKEFLLFKDLMRFGSSPSMEIYLFNDPLVAGHHANLRMVGGEADIEAAGARPIEVNTRRVDRARLHHGDRITIGRTSFVFEKRGG
jgi:pSer/pThr/pTyr-binding forkhead associated (FHA) protein